MEKLLESKYSNNIARFFLYIIIIAIIFQEFPLELRKNSRRKSSISVLLSKFSFYVRNSYDFNYLKEKSSLKIHY